MNREIITSWFENNSGLDDELLEYSIDFVDGICRSINDKDRIINICQRFVDENANGAFSPVFFAFAVLVLEAPSSNISSGYVYVMKTGDRYKIGISKNIKKRFSAIQTSNPEEIEIIRKYRINKYQDIENEIHKMFSNKKIKNEWFSLEDDDIALIDVFIAERGGSKE